MPPREVAPSAYFGNAAELYRGAVDAIESGLDLDELAKAKAQGRTMDMMQALDYALADPPPEGWDAIG